MSKIIICRGLPASGKSFFAKQWVLEDSEHRVRINQDDIRLMLGKYWVPKREKLVRIIQDNAISRAIQYGFNIVIDNTNLNPETLEQLTKLITECELQFHVINLIEYKDFFNTPLSTCIERDKHRKLQVTEEVIREFFERYKDTYPLNGN